MSVFVYTARSKDGQKVDGTVEASDRRAALLQIERLGHVPVSVAEKSAPAQSAKAGARFTWRRSKHMGMREMLVFTMELSDLLASGMKLGNALNTLANRKSGRAGDEIITEIRDEIIRGASLSDALARHPRTFPGLYVSMIRAGEAGGALDEALRRLVDHFDRIQETREKVVMALVYPMIVMVMGAATLVFSMVFVVPKFEMVFRQMRMTLPLPTRILIASSTWMAHYGWLAAIGAVVAGVMINRAVKTAKGRFWWHGVQLRMPLVRGVIASGVFANFARTLGTLMGNGVQVLQALAIVSKTVGNDVIGAEIQNARARVTDGTTISGPLAAGGVFPQMLTDMLAIGEQTGDMKGALAHIANRYEHELDRNIKIFTTALEPILIVVVALGVGFVAISILMAVFSLTSGLDV
jgi:type II secretory pathway component PulF